MNWEHIYVTNVETCSNGGVCTTRGDKTVYGIRNLTSSFQTTMRAMNPNPKQPDLQVRRKGDDKVDDVPDPAVQTTRRQIKGTDPVATTAVIASQIWKRKETKESAAR